ncbi:hypothetical protein KUTeg_005491 [Tegillarca granosa]|uniref:START domain-containing protein n=1 Tax=Tegillarca granosa TaxID=220873 RepID=A0ABQ9FJU4_TEGGR|nr:hypothetical protein KUTeg_005491 [Tegillarca granosa]
MRNFFHHCLRCQWAKSKDFSSFKTALNHNSLYQRWSEKFFQNFSLFGQLVVKNFHSVAAHQIRRTLKFGSFYRNVYGDKCFMQLFNKFGGSKLRNAKVKFCFAAVLFSWDKEKVSDMEINSTIEDMNEIEHIEQLHLKHPEYMKSWELVIDREHLKLWRKPLPTSTYLYEYKVYGTFYDISAQSFFDIQVDLEYRKKWDKLAIQLDIVDKDQQSGSEVVHWVTHFPYPMYSRDYVYVRRWEVC